MAEINYQVKNFMWDKLSLKGSELVTYALIYSFSRNDGDGFYGSQATLAECTGASVSTVKRTLTSLSKKGLIEKSKSGNYVVYKCTPNEYINEDDYWYNDIDINSGEVHDVRYKYVMPGYKQIISMTSEQYEYLLSLVGLEMVTLYVNKLERFLLNDGYRIRNAYRTILRWIKKDTRV